MIPYSNTGGNKIEARRTIQTTMSVSKKDACFRSKYITEELIRIFTEDSDKDEDFEGFTEGSYRINLESEQGSDEDTGFYFQDDSKFPAKKRAGLRVAFRFRPKKGPARGKAVNPRPEDSDSHLEEQNGPWDSGTGNVRGRVSGEGAEGHSAPVTGVPGEASTELDSQSEDEDEDEDEEKQPSALQKRATNMRENKAMLEKLLADLNMMPELYSIKTPLKKKKRTSPRKPTPVGQSERRNPARGARPPANFGVTNPSISPSKCLAQLGGSKRRRSGAKLTGVSEVRENPPRRSSRRSVAPTVKDITTEELDNVACTSKDKIHDKEHGSTCHQCRQKTLDTKTVCRNPKCWGVRGQFCGPCLRNRYGEDIRTALLDSMWVCPTCRGICNCSFCRKRDGRCATGTLVHMAKFYGHDNVKEYLDSLHND